MVAFNDRLHRRQPSENRSSEEEDAGAELDFLKPISSASRAAVDQTAAEGEFSSPALPPLHHACQRGDFDTAKRLLESGEIKATAVDSEKTTPLHWAAGGNFFAICNLLLDHGADPNAQGGSANAAPIHWACRSGNAYIVHLLLSRGADSTLVDGSGFSLLHLSVHSSNVLMVIYLVHLEISIDAEDLQKRTALHWALSQGDHLSVEVLLKSGASPHKADGSNVLPLQLAMNARNISNCTLLLRFGADPSCLTSEAMLCPEWKASVAQCGRREDGSLITLPSWMSDRTGWWIVTLVPFFCMTLTYILTTYFGLLGYLLSGPTLFYFTVRYISRHIVPALWPRRSPMMLSTFSMGVFCAVYVWIIFVYFSSIAPSAFRHSPGFVTFTSIVALSVAYFYYLSASRDPGIVLPGNVAERLTSIHSLMNDGVYDTRHFSINTFAVIPPRAQYDHFSETVILRFDHYCPWTANAVGMHNHRSFALFLITLCLGLELVGYQYFGYLRSLGKGSIWRGAYNSLLSVQLAAISIFQATWIHLVAGTQCFQIAIGKSSYEISRGASLSEDQNSIFGSLPTDHPKASQYHENSSPSASSAHNRSHHRHKGKWNTCFRLLGIQQAREASRVVIRMSRKPDLKTWGRNCVAFWSDSIPSADRYSPSTTTYARAPSPPAAHTTAGV